MKQGTINVQTENIFPVIKKFLYSDTEIFLRELVSNAVDADQKLKTLSTVGEFKGELGDLKVEVIADKDAKTLTIRDNGVGMTAEEVDKYINQIAFSGAEEFVQKYKDQDSNSIIGHFGLGFYSAFMVAEKVQIRTLSFKDDSKAVQWESNGTPEYTLQEIDKTTRGTDIVLYIAEDSLEYLEEGKISTILNKYCKFLPIPVVFGTKKVMENDPSGEKDDKGEVKQIEVEEPNQINNPNPIWTKQPSELKDEDYKAFYRELYPMNFDEPLFHIHLNVDFPFNLTGVLFFPKLKNNVEVQKNKINLYSNQVFITDNVDNIVPEFLTLLHGVIDSPDIPLNVSRSYLQADKNVKKISSYITKKVADKLNSMFKNDRADFEKKWDDIKIFMEYGMLTDEKFFDRASKYALLKDTDNNYSTFEEYNEKVKELNKNKDGKVVYLYTTNVVEQHTFVEAAKDRGYSVLSFDSPLTPHYIQTLESKLDNVQFARVDSDTIDKLIQKEVELPSKLNDTEKEALKPVFEEHVDKQKFTVVFENMSEKDLPIIITQSEFMRRMKEQQALGGGGMQMFGNMPETFNLVVNSNHDLITKINSETDENLKKELADQAIDLALLSQGMLKGKDLSDFINRSIDILK